MARNGFAVAVVVMLTFLGSSALAQNNDLAGVVGRTFISDQGVPAIVIPDNTVRFGNGLTYEVSYGRRLVNIGLASLTVEVPFVHDPEVKLNFGENDIPKSFSAIYLTPSARVNFFPTTAFSPWISGGAGFARFGESDTLVFGGSNPGKTGTTTSAVQLGIGLDLRILGPFKLRGQIRDFYTGLPNLNVNPQKHMHNYFAGAGVVWSF
jgi:hypothetical protein